ncbi:MAG: hypothetical protein J7M09_04080 [Deltaproteobacteria bacterium]|nr:hypothetical protein [Candidatus Tharpella sp.]
MWKRFFVLGLSCVVLFFVVWGGGSPPDLIKAAYGGVSTADHNRFTELDKPFASGPEVTKACLKCHNLAAGQVHQSVHWTWGSAKDKEKGLGKAHIANSF